VVGEELATVGVDRDATEPAVVSADQGAVRLKSRPLLG